MNKNGWAQVVTGRQNYPKCALALPALLLLVLLRRTDVLAEQLDVEQLDEEAAEVYAAIPGALIALERWGGIPSDEWRGLKDELRHFEGRLQAEPWYDEPFMGASLQRFIQAVEFLSDVSLR